MKKFILNNYLSLILGFSSLVFMWLTWIIIQVTIKNEYLIPSFSDTINAFFALLNEEFFYKALSRTLLKVLVAFAVSFLLAIVVAGVGKLFKSTRSFFKPILSIIRTLPTMAILVLILIYTDRTTAPIIVASLVLFPMMYAQFSTSFDMIDDGIIKATKVFNLSKKDKLFKVYLPLIAPSVLLHTGSNLSFAIKLIISAEVMAYTFTSIGGMMESANATLDISRLMALTLVAVLLGLLVELIFNVIYKCSFKWLKGEDEGD